MCSCAPLSLICTFLFPLLQTVISNGDMSTETILILGGAFAGMSAAHYALKHVIPQLPKKDGTTYNVTVVNPSKDFFWYVNRDTSSGC